MFFLWIPFFFEFLERWQNIGVSKNSGTPKSSHFNRVFHYFHHPFWGSNSPYFWFNTHIFGGNFPPDLVKISRFVTWPTVHRCSPSACPMSEWSTKLQILSTQCSKFARFPGELGGGFKYFLFSPLLGEMIQFDKHILQMGWNHELENCVWKFWWIF